MAEIKYEIVRHIGVIGKANGWSKELNLVSWNNSKAKYDIRSWNRDDEDDVKMTKGITLTAEELAALVELAAAVEE